jgi:anaerobic ribonucleoside-triphosphate reductase activating protein
MSDTLQVAEIVESTEVEGIGLRYVIWTQGCSFKCKNCCNPHLWAHKGGDSYAIPDLWSKIRIAKEKNPKIEGVTFVGGEPLEQASAVASLAKLIKEYGLSVMVFTGFLYEDLLKNQCPVLPYVDVIVDGLYIDSLRTIDRRFVGSSNQKMHFLTDFYTPDDPRWAEPNMTEIIMNGQGRIQVVGFPFDAVVESFGPKKNKKKLPMV